MMRRPEKKGLGLSYLLTKPERLVSFEVLEVKKEWVIPTVLRKNGFRFFFYSREGNEPAHIHVIGRNGEMKVWLDPVSVSKVYNLKSKDQKNVVEIVNENKAFLLDSWRQWHESDS